MADLLSKEMIGDLIINIINILILFFVTKMLLYKPVKKMLDARKEKAAALTEQAEKAIEEANSKKAEYDELLLKADREKTEAVESARAEAETAAQSMISDAERQAKDIVTEAKAKAAHEREKAVSDAKKDIVDAALGISEKILAREVNDADNKKLIDSFFDGQESL